LDGKFRRGNYGTSTTSLLASRLLRRRRAYRRTTDASRKLVSRDVAATFKLA